MIEVEKKFTLSKDDKARVVQGAEFLGEKSFRDTYYDTSDFALTTSDKWLRLRGDRFELKLPMNEGKGASSRRLDQYEELDTDEAILQALNLSLNGSLKQTLKVNGYEPFSTFTTTRKKYKKGDFTIDLDEMDFGYSIAEIELMVEGQSEMQKALERILAFAREHGLSVAPVRGKVIEYIKRNNPVHYKALEAAGVL